MDNRRKTHITLVDQGLVSGVNFITGLILARFLGLDGYGQFILAYGVIQFLASIQMALIISPMMITGATIKKSEHNSYFLSVILLQIVFSFSALAAILLFGNILDGLIPALQLNALLTPLAFAAFFFLTQDMLRRYLFVTNASAHALLNDFLSYGLQALVLIALGVTTSLNTPLVLWIIAITSGIAVSAALIKVIRQTGLYPLPTKHTFTNTTREHWDFGKWLLGKNMVYWGSSQFVIYLAAGMISVAAVGALAATRNIVGIANIMFLAMENFVPSRAAKAYEARGFSGLSRYIRRVSVLGGSATLAIVLIASLFPEFWLNLFYGAQYQEYAWLILWWGIFYLIGFFQRPLTAGLRSLNNTRAIFISNVMGFLIALIVSYPIISYSGLVGTMMVLCLIQFAISLCLYIYLQKAKE